MANSTLHKDFNDNSSAYGCTPYVVGILKICTPKEVLGFMLQQYPDLKAQLVYRYLQVWCSRYWIEKAPDKQRWQMCEHTLQQTIGYAEKNWPLWLTQLGHKPEDMALPPEEGPTPAQIALAELRAKSKRQDDDDDNDSEPVEP